MMDMFDFMYLTHMFFSQLVFALEIIALTASVCLMIWGMRHEGIGTGFAKVFGIVAMIVVILLMLSSVADLFRLQHASNDWARNHVRNMQLMQNHKNMNGNMNDMINPMMMPNNAPSAPPTR